MCKITDVWNLWFSYNAHFRLTLIMTKKNIIAHLINLDNVAGVERLYCELINANLENIEHHTISSRNKIAKILLKEINTGSETIHFEKKHNIFSLPKWPYFLRKRHLKNVLRKISPTIIIVWNKPEGFDLSLMPSHTKTIYYEHGSAWNRHNKNKVHDFINHVSGVICNSSASQKMLQLKWKIKTNTNYHICLNAIRPHCVPSIFKAKTLPHTKPFNLGVAARLIPLKGICLAIQAIRELKLREIPCRLLIAGIGPEQKKLHLLTQQLNLENDIQFCNLVDNMTEFYHQIDCFLCPSLREPFGLVVAEAMAHGCPAIVSAIDGLPEVVTHGKNGFCIEPTLDVKQYIDLGGTETKLPEYTYSTLFKKIIPPKLLNPVHLADHIQRLYSEPALFKKMSQEAIKSAKTQFNFDNYIRRFKNILQQY